MRTCKITFGTVLAVSMFGLGVTNANADTPWGVTDHTGQTMAANTGNPSGSNSSTQWTQTDHSSNKLPSAADTTTSDTSSTPTRRAPRRHIHVSKNHDSNHHNARNTCTVESGDTLSSIGANHGIDWHELVDLNKGRYPSLVDNPDLIQIGWSFVCTAH